MKTNPRAMPMVASVVSKGLTPILVMARPFSNPQPAADSKATRIASHGGRPEAIATATTTPLEANTDPTDKSKSAGNQRDRHAGGDDRVEDQRVGDRQSVGERWRSGAPAD